MDRLGHALGYLHDIIPQARCHRRQIACVLVDKNGNVVSSATNGVDLKIGDCHRDAICPDATVEAGEGAYRPVRCWGVHAEQRAVAMAFATFRTPVISVTNKAPCPACVQLLHLAGVRTIIFETDSNDQDNREVAHRLGMTYLTVDQAREAPETLNAHR